MVGRGKPPDYALRRARRIQGRSTNARNSASQASPSRDSSAAYRATSASPSSVSGAAAASPCRPSRRPPDDRIPGSAIDQQPGPLVREAHRARRGGDRALDRRATGRSCRGRARSPRRSARAAAPSRPRHCTSGCPRTGTTRHSRAISFRLEQHQVCGAQHTVTSAPARTECVRNARAGRRICRRSSGRPRGRSQASAWRRVRSLRPPSRRRGSRGAAWACRRARAARSTAARPSEATRRPAPSRSPPRATRAAPSSSGSSPGAGGVGPRVEHVGDVEAARRRLVTRTRQHLGRRPGLQQRPCRTSSRCEASCAVSSRSCVTSTIVLPSRGRRRSSTYALAGAAVDRRERLVEQQHPGRARSPGPAPRVLLAARSSCAAGAARAGDVRERDALARALPASRGIEVKQRGFDVGLHGQVREQRVALRHQADRAISRLAMMLCVVPDVVAERDASAPDAQQACDGAQDRGLAAAGRPDQRGDAAGRHLGDELERWPVVVQRRATLMAPAPRRRPPTRS